MVPFSLNVSPTSKRARPPARTAARPKAVAAMRCPAVQPTVGGLSGVYEGLKVGFGFRPSDSSCSQTNFKIGTQRNDTCAKAPSRR